MNNRDYQLQRLTDAQIADPRKVLREFFSSFPLEDFRETLRNYIYLVVKSDEETEHFRANALYMAEMLEKIVECSFVIQKERKPKQAKKRA